MVWIILWPYYVFWSQYHDNTIFLGMQHGIRIFFVAVPWWQMVKASESALNRPCSTCEAFKYCCLTGSFNFLMLANEKTSENKNLCNLTALDPIAWRKKKKKRKNTDRFSKYVFTKASTFSHFNDLCLQRCMFLLKHFILLSLQVFYWKSQPWVQYI